MPHPREPCECELRGEFYTGVPGILAALNNGRLDSGTVVERCDFCRRYPSDATAFAKLRELGLVDAAGSARDVRTFTVQCHAIVRVEFSEVVAADSQSAADRVLDRFNWDLHGCDAQLVDHSELVVLVGQQKEETPRRLRIALDETDS